MRKYETTFSMTKCAPGELYSNGARDGDPGVNDEDEQRINATTNAKVACS